MEVGGKKVEMVEKKLEVVELEKEVEMVGLGHYTNIQGCPLVYSIPTRTHDV